MMPEPADPVAAVTHADPYPYYAGLVARRPMHRDARLGLWIAAGARDVASVLDNPLCRVRPPAEPVPRPIAASPAGNVFRHLVRMNDGAGHCPFKRAVAATLESLEAARVSALAERWARRLAGSADVNAFAFALPVHVVGSLLGVQDDAVPALVPWIDAFVRCLAPGADGDTLARGNEAAERLRDMVTHCDGQGLFAVLAREAERVGRAAPDVIAANGIGLLMQTWEATAGLIGNTLVALARHREAASRAARDPAVLRRFVLEVLRHDPPVQNTRRFVAGDGVVAGQAMTAGDAILVVLAAANRDPAANPDPDRFDVDRTDRCSFTFGAGVHACPGEALAVSIAQAGVARLIAAGLQPDRLLDGLRYRPSVNTRIPVFADRRLPAGS